MEWRHSGSPRPKNSEGKNPLENSRLEFFGIKTASSSLIVFQRAKLSPRSIPIPHFSWCNCRTFEGKTPEERHQGVVVFCTTMPRLTRHLQPRRNWPTSASSVFITHPILRIWPSRTTIFRWTGKAIEMSPFFVRRRGHCRRGDLVGRTWFWNFFSSFQKLEQWAKKCIELRRDCVE